MIRGEINVATCELTLATLVAQVRPQVCFLCVEAKHGKNYQSIHHLSLLGDDYFVSSST